MRVSRLTGQQQRPARIPHLTNVGMRAPRLDGAPHPLAAETRRGQGRTSRPSSCSFALSLVSPQHPTITWETFTAFATPAPATATTATTATSTITTTAGTATTTPGPPRVQRAETVRHVQCALANAAERTLFCTIFLTLPRQQERCAQNQNHPRRRHTACCVSRRETTQGAGVQHITAGTTAFSTHPGKFTSSGLLAWNGSNWQRSCKVVSASMA